MIRTLCIIYCVKPDSGVMSSTPLLGFCQEYIWELLCPWRGNHSWYHLFELKKGMCDSSQLVFWCHFLNLSPKKRGGKNHSSFKPRYVLGKLELLLVWQKVVKHMLWSWATDYPSSLTMCQNPTLDIQVWIFSQRIDEHLLWDSWDMHRAWQFCLVHVTNHYLVCIKEHSLPTRHHEMYPWGKSHPEPLKLTPSISISPWASPRRIILYNQFIQDGNQDGGAVSKKKAQPGFFFQEWVRLGATGALGAASQNARKTNGGQMEAQSPKVVFQQSARV